MSYAESQFQTPDLRIAALASENERAGFITKTYLHLVGAIVAFVILEAALLQLPIAESFALWAATTRFGWLAGHRPVGHRYS